MRSLLFVCWAKFYKKIVQDKATVIGTPEWPSKSWFTLFHILRLSAIHRIYVTDDTLFLPHWSDLALSLGAAHHLRHPLARASYSPGGDPLRQSLEVKGYDPAVVVTMLLA